MDCGHLNGFMVRLAMPAIAGISLLSATILSASASDMTEWSAVDVLAIKELAITNLPLLPKDPSNRVADEPQAAALGKALFFDARFSGNGAVACSSCHRPERQFQDDLPVGHGVSDGTRRTMPLAGTAYHPFFFWDGRKDSQWSQALGPLENPVEHGADRTMIVQLVAANYKNDYTAVFGAFPDLGTLPAHAAPAGTPQAVAAWAAMRAEQQKAVNIVFSNMGKAIEAFERTIPVPTTRFDDYATAVMAKDWAKAGGIFTSTESHGLKLFIDKGCLKCHLGPQFTDMTFHNIALPGNTAAADSGRISSAHAVKDDPFNCLGDYSDSKTFFQCQPIRNVTQFDLPAQAGAFKSPSLRGVAQRPPYMHNGKFATLHDVIVHYNNAPAASFGTSELPGPRKMSEQDMIDMEAFLVTLNVVQAVAK